MIFTNFADFVCSKEAENLYREDYEADKTSPVYEGMDFREYIESDFWIDCDYIKLNGLTENWFVIVRTDDDLIVIFLKEYELIEKLAVRAIFAGDLKTADEQTWEYYRTHNNCITYRGGIGYSYVIYDLEKNS